MALSGSVSTNLFSEEYGTVGLVLSWSATQSVANNTSTVSWTLKTYGSMSSGWWYKAGPISMLMTATSGSFSGSHSYSQSGRIELRGGGTQIASGTATLAHNTTGVGAFSISISAAIYYTHTNVSGNGTASLNDIPRATTPALKNTSGTVITSQNIGSAIRIDVSGRASTAFSHELSYTFGNSTASIGTIASNASNQYYDWTPAANTFGPLLVNSDSATCSITCVTKNGTNTIGTKTVNITLTAPSTWVPSNSTSCAPLNNALGANVYPAVASAVVVTVTCAGSNSSTVSNVTVTFQDKTYTTTTITNDVATITTDACVGSGSYNLTSVVTDSRGRTATVNNITIIVSAYTSPAIALSIFRTESDSSTTMAETGNYMRIEFAGTVANIGSNAVVAVTLKYKIGSTTTTLISGTTATYNGNVAVGNDTTCEVTATVKDTAGITTSVSKVLPIGYKTLDFLAGGHGITFGGGAVNPNFVTNMDLVIGGKLYRKNLMKVTANTATSNNITFTVDKEAGTVTSSAGTVGSSHASINIYRIYTGELIPGNKYILSGCPSGGSTTTYCLYIGRGNYAYYDTGNGIEFTYPTDSTVTYMTVVARLYKSKTYSEHTFYPMIRDAGIADNTFEKYIPDIPEVQTDYNTKISSITTDLTSAQSAITSIRTKQNLNTFRVASQSTTINLANYAVAGSSSGVYLILLRPWTVSLLSGAVYIVSYITNDYGAATCIEPTSNTSLSISGTTITITFPNQDGGMVAILGSPII